MKKRNEPTIKENYIWGLIRSGSGLIFPLIIFAYASRILSSDGIGKVDFTRSIVSYFTYFATLGVSTYGIREAAKVRDNKNQLSQIVKEIFLINVFSTIFAYLLFFGAISIVPQFAEYKKLFLICGLAIGFTSLGLDWFYSAIEEYRYITVRTIIFQIISLISVFLLVKNSNDYHIYAFVLTFSAVGSNVLNFFHARKYLNLRSLEKPRLKRHIKPILIFFSNSIAGNIYQTLDTSMVGLISTDSAVGLYSASVKMNRVFIGIITILPTVILPRVSYYIEKREIQKYRILLKQVFDCIVMLSLPMAGILFVMSDEILVLFSGDAFLPASLCAKTLASIVIFLPISTFAVNQILIPFGQERQQFIATIFGAIIDLIMNLIFIPRFAHLGAAIGTVVTVLCVATLTMIMSSKCLDIKFLFKGIWKYILAAIIFLMTVFAVKAITVGVWAYILPMIVGGLVYGALLILLKDSLFSIIIVSVKNYLRRRR